MVRGPGNKAMTMYDTPQENTLDVSTDRSQEVEELGVLEVLWFEPWSVADVQCTNLARNLQEHV